MFAYKSDISPLLCLITVTIDQMLSWSPLQEEYVLTFHFPPVLKGHFHCAKGVVSRDREDCNLLGNSMRCKCLILNIITIQLTYSR